MPKTKFFVEPKGKQFQVMAHGANGEPTEIATFGSENHANEVAAALNKLEKDAGGTVAAAHRQGAEFATVLLALKSLHLASSTVPVSTLPEHLRKRFVAARTQAAELLKVAEGNHLPEKNGSEKN